MILIINKIININIKQNTNNNHKEKFLYKYPSEKSILLGQYSELILIFKTILSTILKCHKPITELY